MRLAKVVRLLVCGGQPLVRSGIRSTVEREEGLTVVADTPDAAGAAPYIVSRQPNMAIVDDAITARTQQRRDIDRLFALDVVLLADEIDVDRLVALLSRDIKAIVNKSGSGSDLVRAIRAVAQGCRFIAPEFTGLLVEVVRASIPRRTPRLDGLTPREREVFALLCQGMANHAIAGNLSISERTVKFHVSNVLAKMDKRTRSELIAGSMVTLPLVLPPNAQDQRD